MRPTSPERRATYRPPGLVPLWRWLLTAVLIGAVGVAGMAWLVVDEQYVAAILAQTAGIVGVLAWTNSTQPELRRRDPEPWPPRRSTPLLMGVAGALLASALLLAEWTVPGLAVMTLTVMAVPVWSRWDRAVRRA